MIQTVKVRIVHIVQSAGGVERYIKMLLKHMDHEKYENILICSNDYRGDEYKQIADSFFSVEMIRKISLFCDFKAILYVRRLLKKCKPDIVYCHSSKAGAVGRIANIGLFNKCLYNPHGWAFNMQASPLKRWMYSCLEKGLATFCDSIVCISNAEKASALKHKICSEKKLTVICNGIDLTEYSNDTFRDMRFELGIPKDSFIVGSVGRLSKQKSPDIFVKAAKIISHQIQNSFFLWVGDGEERHIVEQLVLAHGLQKQFHITGWVSNPYPYISSFDVATLLSRWEGFGLVLAEYMLAQKPVVATNIDAIPEAIHHEYNGILVPIDDEIAVASAVAEFYLDRVKADTFSKNGLWIVNEKYSISRVVLEHESLFRHVMT